MNAVLENCSSVQRCLHSAAMEPLLVRIVKNYTNPNLLRQTPGGLGIWDGIQFTTDPVEQCDYVIVLNHALQHTTVRCAAGNIWGWMQEPPNETYRHMHRGNTSMNRVYVSDPTLKDSRYIQCPPAVPWTLDRDYDYLKALPPPEKPKKMSWVTGSGNHWKGHKIRMRFMKRIINRVPFDLYGRGFNPIPDKWLGIAPYRYSIAFENFASPIYWSEKIVDCFLTWTMPIYFGCSRINNFFPPESMIRFDPDDPDVADKIREAIESDAWIRNRDAIAHARELVLQHYQMFPLLSSEIRAHQLRTGLQNQPCKPITIPGRAKPPLSVGRATKLALVDSPLHLLWRARRKYRYLRGLPI